MPGLPDFKALLNQQIGYPVQSDGSTKYGRDYGKAYAKSDFCDMGLSWVAKYSGNTKEFGHFAYVPSHRNWFISKGQYSKTLHVDSPIFFDWNGNGIPNHIGWLVSFDGHEIHTIEFNHTRTVGKFTRPRNSYIMGVGLVKWPVVSAPTPTKAVGGDFYIA